MQLRCVARPAAGYCCERARWLLGTLGFVLGIGLNTLLSIAVLTGPPRTTDAASG